MKFWASILTLTFGTTRTAEFSAIRAGRTFPSRRFFGVHFCQRVCVPQGYSMWTEGLGHLQISNRTVRPK